jgi:hypothetical protein
MRSWIPPLVALCSCKANGSPTTGHESGGSRDSHACAKLPDVTDTDAVAVIEPAETDCDKRDDTVVSSVNVGLVVDCDGVRDAAETVSVAVASRDGDADGFVADGVDESVAVGANVKVGDDLADHETLIVLRERVRVIVTSSVVVVLADDVAVNVSVSVAATVRVAVSATVRDSVSVFEPNVLVMVLSAVNVDVLVGVAVGRRVQERVGFIVAVTVTLELGVSVDVASLVKDCVVVGVGGGVMVGVNVLEMGNDNVADASRDPDLDAVAVAVHDALDVRELVIVRLTVPDVVMVEVGVVSKDGEPLSVALVASCE